MFSPVRKITEIQELCGNYAKANNPNPSLTSLRVASVISLATAVPFRSTFMTYAGSAA
jgi:hypothetical protein